MKNFTLRCVLYTWVIAILMAVSSIPATAGIIEEVQWETVTIELKNSTISNALDLLAKQSGIRVFYKSDQKDLKKNVNLSFKNEKLGTALKRVLEGTNLDFEVSEKGIVIIPKENVVTPANVAQQQKKITISGRVIGEDKKPIASATLSVKGTTIGTITDGKGEFTLSFIAGSDVEISFVGMTSVVKKFNVAENNVVIELNKSTIVVDDVVVTGYFERNKNSFTGAAKTVSGDELRRVSSTNILNSLTILDPSIQIVQNNDQGSNPNNIPELIIRGTSSLNTSNEAGVNSPLIVIDGVESNLRALYDMDVFDIENVSILKDASATALYGEQAANGVILVTRKHSSEKNLRVSYNFVGKVEFPDLSDYNLMNAREKLDFEKYSGEYDDKTGAKYQEYIKKLSLVNSGVNTDWIAKPLRNAFSHTHNVSVSGEGSRINYQVTARYSSVNGVMKTDNRTNIGLGFYLSYNYKGKVIATFRSDFSQYDVDQSKYGRFQDYVNANPYDSPYDKNGEFNTILSHSLKNPLYECTLSSFSTSKQKSYINSLNIRWNIIPGLYIVGFGSIDTDDTRSDRFISPKSAVYSTETDPAKKGEYFLDASAGSRYMFRGTANYNLNLDKKGSLLAINAGGEIRSGKTDPYGFSSIGFLNDKLVDPTFASGFPTGSKPTGISSETASVAFVSSLNLSFRNRYFIDGSYRLSGSSNFGKNQRYAPFWSAGIGWNLHKESFLQSARWIDILRIKSSYGHRGSIAFSPYQAMTTYKYNSDLAGRFTIGAIPITMGNPDLKWQTTKSFNVGLTSSFLRGRLDLNVDYYSDRTVDMIVPVSMPLSSGIETTVRNIGEQTNRGFEILLSGKVISKKDLTWTLNLNAAHNVNKLVKIGNALSKNNAKLMATSGISPLSMYIEGESTTMLYAVRSAGIDPMSGREIFITKDGQMTFNYDPNDKVALGDTNPTLRGSLSSYLYYKGFSFNINFQYSMGGYIYNSTRAFRIEQVNPKFNADKRAYAQRWKEMGDVVEYLSIKPDAHGNTTSNHTQRFVEKENYLSISYVSLGYEFATEKLNKIGFKRLNLSISMNDMCRFSTVRQERGTSYPFARGFSFTISPTF